MTTHPEPTMHDMIDELTTNHTHRERFTRERNRGGHWSGNHLSTHHVTNVPSLVHQLLDAQPQGSGEEAGGTGGKSRPAARIESIDTLILIDHEAAQWVRILGDDDPGDTYRNGKRIPGSGTISCLRKVHALHASAKTCGALKARRNKDTGRPECCPAHLIEHDIRRWWRQARIITGWDSPAWRPDNTCPVCEQRRSLRINLHQQAAFCVECRAIWEPDEIGILAAHIMEENDEDCAPEVAS